MKLKKRTIIDEQIELVSTLSNSLNSFKDDLNKSVVNLKDKLNSIKVEFDENYAKKDGSKKKLKTVESDITILWKDRASTTDVSNLAKNLDEKILLCQ